jgi:uncharacterized protein (DUF433 family)
MATEALPIAADPAPLEISENGRVLVAGTDLPFEFLMGCYVRGDTPEEIVSGFPVLTLAKVYRLYSYYLDHRAEVDAWYAEVRREEERMAAELRRLFPQPKLYARLEEMRAERRDTRPQ